VPGVALDESPLKGDSPVC